MKERVAAMETQTNLPSCPTSLPRSHFRQPPQGLLGSKTKRQIYLSKFFFFHRSRSPGACGHPGLGHFPRELTRFPFSTEDQFRLATFSFSFPWPGSRRGRREGVGLLGGGRVSECLPCGLRGKAWFPSSARTFFSPLSPHPPRNCTRAHTHTHTHTTSTAAATDPLAVSGV